MFYFTESEVQELLPVTEAIRLMRLAFEAQKIGRAVNQPRRRLILESGSVLHSMAGAVGNYFGTKFYSTNPRYDPRFEDPPHTAWAKLKRRWPYARGGAVLSSPAPCSATKGLSAFVG